MNENLIIYQLLLLQIYNFKWRFYRHNGLAPQMLLLKNGPSSPLEFRMRSQQCLKLC